MRNSLLQKEGERKEEKGRKKEDGKMTDCQFLLHFLERERKEMENEVYV